MDSKGTESCFKNVLRKCVTCRRYQGRPLLTPETPDLPDYRVNTLYACQGTGLDYAEPLFIKKQYRHYLKSLYFAVYMCVKLRSPSRVDTQHESISI